MQLPDDVLGRPVQEAARLFALAFLEEAQAAAPRLTQGDDPEALHDLRVGLRRLKSALRAYRPYLRGALKKSLLRELRDLTDATGAGRDAEVLLAWVEAQRDGLLPREHSGLRWLVASLEHRRGEGYARVYGDVAPRFAVLAPKLRVGLEMYSVPMRLGEKRGVRTLAVALAELVLAHADELAKKLAQARTVNDEDAGHGARIATKRLRYLLEPVHHLVPGADGLLRDLKALQDVFGELHDLYVLAHELGDAASCAAAERARRLHDLALAGDPGGKSTRRAVREDERHGLIALATRVQVRRETLFRSVKRRFLGARAAALIDAAREVARELTAHAHRGQEIERKYLLSEVPPEVVAAPSKQLVQGYLPGERLIERLRKVVAADGTVTCFRTVKLGAGLVRVEVEEETPEELFRKLWPMTRGRRVSKRRHYLQEGERTWEIDVFLDRTLVLAELELGSAEEQVTLPAWLAPYVVREVTDEPEYVNARLAK